MVSSKSQGSASVAAEALQEPSAEEVTEGNEGGIPLRDHTALPTPFSNREGFR